MSFISVATKLWHAVLAALHFTRKLCSTVERMNNRVQNSTMPDNIKTAAANLKTATDSFCSLLQAYKGTLD